MEKKMAERVVNTDGLIVIGYNDVIKKTEVPRRVSPVFKFNYINAKYADKCLFPPFRLVDNLIIGGTIEPESDFEEMVQTETATKLSKSFPAIPQGMLWVDENLAIHYGNQKEENDKLKEQAYLKLKSGIEVFYKKDLEGALKCAMWASAANQQSLKALALQAAVYKTNENGAGLKLIKQMAENVPEGLFLDDEVNLFLEKYYLKNVI